MNTPKSYLVPTALVTTSCLFAVLYGCGGCVSAETVSDLDALALDLSTETGEAFDMPPQPDPKPSPVEPCTTQADACCWCGATDEPVCAVGPAAAGCSDIGGEVVADCVLVSFPPYGTEGPFCQFQCV